jgi:hypothetical protein
VLDVEGLASPISQKDALGWVTQVCSMAASAAGSTGRKVKLPVGRVWSGRVSSARVSFGPGAGRVGATGVGWSVMP